MATQIHILRGRAIRVVAQILLVSPALLQACASAPAVAGLTYNSPVSPSVGAAANGDAEPRSTNARALSIASPSSGEDLQEYAESCSDDAGLGLDVIKIIGSLVGAESRNCYAARECAEMLEENFFCNNEEMSPQDIEVDVSGTGTCNGNQLTVAAAYLWSQHPAPLYVSDAIPAANVTAVLNEFRGRNSIVWSPSMADPVGFEVLSVADNIITASTPLSPAGTDVDCHFTLDGSPLAAIARKAGQILGKAKDLGTVVGGMVTNARTFFSSIFKFRRQLQTQDQVQDQSLVHAQHVHDPHPLARSYPIPTSDRRQLESEAESEPWAYPENRELLNIQWDVSGYGTCKGSQITVTGAYLWSQYPTPMVLTGAISAEYEQEILQAFKGRNSIVWGPSLGAKPMGFDVLSVSGNVITTDRPISSSDMEVECHFTLDGIFGFFVRAIPALIKAVPRIIRGTSDLSDVVNAITTNGGSDSDSNNGNSS
jgi:hypothetical protein